MWMVECVWLLFIMYEDGGYVLALVYNVCGWGLYLALVYIKVVHNALSSFVIISLKKRVVVSFLIMFLPACG